MAKTRIVALNKPYGVLTQFTCKDGRPTLSQFSLPADVYPAGRLDFDSEGLLLLTDDGGLLHRLTDPRHAHPRVYWAQIERVPSEESLKSLRRGVILSDGKTLTCGARLLDTDLPPRDPPIRSRLNVPTAWIEMTMIEGRNRQVRRMTAAIGHPCLRLVRTAVGKVTLRDLAPGKWRWVDRREMVSGFAF
jgi:23S rRNA pseudouridine2457 synthase